MQAGSRGPPHFFKSWPCWPSSLLPSWLGCAAFRILLVDWSLSDQAMSTPRKRLLLLRGSGCCALA